jgi:hypothetical protein
LAPESLAAELRTIRNASSEKARRVFGWSPRPNSEAIAATGESWSASAC